MRILGKRTELGPRFEEDADLVDDNFKTMQLILQLQSCREFKASVMYYSSAMLSP